METGLVHELRRFWEAWLDEMPARERKNLSCFGALRRRERESDELVFRPHQEYRVEDYFDPGNHIYALAFKSLWSDMASQRGLGNVTLGDLFESVLGYEWLHHGRTNEAWLTIAMWIDSFVYAVYRHACCTDSCTRNLSAWRRQLPPTMNHHLVLNDNVW